MEVFYEKDSNPELLKDKTISITGENFLISESETTIEY